MNKRKKKIQTGTFVGIKKLLRRRMDNVTVNECTRFAYSRYPKRTKKKHFCNQIDGG